ncbi:Os04g0586850 [Oryza sativa Japonica Group]|uniref:Os04g0586850 protein n=1 Tax=Oryza sativa subsp. japonica TaxID=39947 RepID=A0A0P0WE16_ORYSJ|nr:hypothetical protein EE612_025227 [Oryza sativa]BAS90711.1 Os04g0586850 [Oryza sativa Japonica Group]
MPPEAALPHDGVQRQVGQRPGDLPAHVQCRQRRRWRQRAHPPKSIPTVVPMESLTVRPAIEVEAPGPSARRRPSSILAFGHDGMHVAMPALGRRRGISSPSRHDF